VYDAQAEGAEKRAMASRCLLPLLAPCVVGRLGRHRLLVLPGNPGAHGRWSNLVRPQRLPQLPPAKHVSTPNHRTKHIRNSPNGGTEVAHPSSPEYPAAIGFRSHSPLVGESE